MTRAQILIAALFVCAGCSSEHELRVRAVTDLVAGPEFARVQVDLVQDDTTGGSTRTLPGGYRTTGVFGDDFAHGRTVATFEDMSPGTYTLRVQLLRPDDTLLVQRRQRVVVAGDTVASVHLTRDCVSVTCPSAGGSPAFTECLAGRCVSPECVPPNEGEACNDVVFCHGADECGQVATCAEATCDEGVCIAAAIDNACDAMSYCDPRADVGCVPYLTDDAAVPDGGDRSDAATDASLDAEVPSCGAVCHPADNPCLAGLWDCAGSPSCVQIGVSPVGTECAEQSVCSALGDCVTCRADATCRIGCRVGHVACGRGFEECVLDEPATLAAPDSSCDNARVCVDGDACGLGDYCDADGNCTTCRSGRACTNGCEHGTVDCAAGGVCVGGEPTSMWVPCAARTKSATPRTNALPAPNEQAAFSPTFAPSGACPARLEIRYANAVKRRIRRGIPAAPTQCAPRTRRAFRARLAKLATLAIRAATDSAPAQAARNARRARSNPRAPRAEQAATCATASARAARPFSPKTWPSRATTRARS